MVSFFGTETSPSSGDSSPTIMRNSVVLPAPLGPTRPTFSPGLSWKEASTNSTCRPYCLLTREKEIIWAARAGLRPGLDGAGDGGDEDFWHERFRHVCVEAGTQHRGAVLRRGVGRHRYHRHGAPLVRRHPSQLADERVAVRARQADVGDDDLRTFAVPGAHRAERLGHRRDRRD